MKDQLILKILDAKLAAKKLVLRRYAVVSGQAMRRYSLEIADGDWMATSIMRWETKSRLEDNDDLPIGEAIDLIDTYLHDASTVETGNFRPLLR